MKKIGFQIYKLCFEIQNPIEIYVTDPLVGSKSYLYSPKTIVKDVDHEVTQVRFGETTQLRIKDP